MSVQVQPPKSVLLVVGREDFTPPSSFGGRACAATSDCVAVGVRDDGDGPTSVSFAHGSVRGDLVSLGTFPFESEGLVSVRDVYSREYLTVGVAPGTVQLEVLGDDESAPGEVVLVIRPG